MVLDFHFYSLVQLWFLPYVLQTFTENVVQDLWNAGIEDVVQTKVAQVTHFARRPCVLMEVYSWSASSMGGALPQTTDLGPEEPRAFLQLG